MLLKTFQAKEMAEALRQVKKELGPDAVIVGSRQVTKKGLFGMFSRVVYEVTATADLQPRKRSFREEQAEREMSTRDELQNSLLAPLAREVRELREQVAALKKERPQVPEGREECQGVPSLPKLSRQSAEVDELDELKKLLLDDGAGPGGELKRQARRSSLWENVAAPAPLKQEQPLPPQKEKAEAIIAGEDMTIPCGGAIRLKKGGMKAVALIGPSGVGKTTMVAKLAAHYALKKGNSVAIVTVDNQRVGALEQLRAFARILDVPLAAASTREDLEAVLDDCTDHDLVIIDTPGINPMAAVQMEELKGLLHGLTADVYLCLSATSSSRCLLEAYGRFSPLHPGRVILTKLDEAGGLGDLVPFLLQARPTVSYLSAGQRVPDDLETATEKRLAELMEGHRPRIKAEEKPVADRIVRWEPPRVHEATPFVSPERAAGRFARGTAIN